MATKVQKAQKLISNLDLFGLPVQLTHQGQLYFKTGLGGCISLLLILVISIGAIIQFRRVYYEPEFNALPPDYEFGLKNLTVNFSANSLAISVGI